MCQTKFLKTKLLYTTVSIIIRHSPRPNCHMISDALNMSNLFTDYKDCPALNFKWGVTNMSHIIMHLENRSSIQHRLRVLWNFLHLCKMQIEFGNEEAWHKICYWDKFESAQVCKEYVPGENEQVAISETNVLAVVLYRMYGAPAKWNAIYWKTKLQTCLTWI